jgi:6,7-dimethyl-8-ribityllumazine synthase
MRHGVAEEDVDVAWVPAGSRSRSSPSRWRLPAATTPCWRSGVVIRGGTPHFEYVASEVAKGVAKASLDSGVPVMFGVITADTIEQAVERAGTKAGNKGWDAALGAIEMANLAKTLR